jgi:hypothetical protein
MIVMMTTFALFPPVRLLCKIKGKENGSEDVLKASDSPQEWT